MQFSCNQDTFSKYINIVSRIVNNKPGLPILNNVAFETVKGKLLMKTTDLELSVNTWIGSDVKSEGKITVPAKQLAEFINSIKSKKHSQRAIKPAEPAPAQMTIPDDLCHYSENQLRTLTVREMARIQSFPDWFVFRSKITTGGVQRKHEVPQYTQVGNAVPPLLAYHLGKTISHLIELMQHGKVR